MKGAFVFLPEGLHQSPQLGEVLPALFDHSFVQSHEDPFTVRVARGTLSDWPPLRLPIRAPALHGKTKLLADERRSTPRPHLKADQRAVRHGETSRKASTPPASDGSSAATPPSPRILVDAAAVVSGQEPAGAIGAPADAEWPMVHGLEGINVAAVVVVVEPRGAHLAVALDLGR